MKITLVLLFREHLPPIIDSEPGYYFKFQDAIFFMKKQESCPSFAGELTYSDSAGQRSRWPPAVGGWYIFLLTKYDKLSLFCAPNSATRVQMALLKLPPRSERVTGALAIVNHHSYRLKTADPRTGFFLEQVSSDSREKKSTFSLSEPKASGSPK